MEGNINKNNPPATTPPQPLPRQQPAPPVVPQTKTVHTPLPPQPVKPAQPGRKKGVIFLKKDGFDYYDESLNTVVSFPYAPGTVSDLEVLDKQALEAGVGQFIDQNKITPATLFIVFSGSTVFEKMIEGMTPKEPEEEIQSFIDNVPFEHVAYKAYEAGKGYRVIAVNEDLFKDVHEVLEQKGFVVTFAVTDFVVPELAGKTGLDSSSAKSLLAKIDALKKQALIIDGIAESRFTASETANEGTPKSTLPILLPVLGILFVILIVVVFLQFSQKPKPSPIPATIIAPTVIPPTEIPTDTPVPATPSAIPPRR